MDTSNPARDFTPEFVARVHGWIAATGEVFVVLRYLRAAGLKDYLFCRSAGDFDALVDSLPPGTDTIVFQHPQLPMRGVSSPEFIADCIAGIPDGAEYVIALTRRPLPLQPAEAGYLDEGHGSLREDLQSFLGRSVAVGLAPGFMGADSASMISASKGGIDGPR